MGTENGETGDYCTEPCKLAYVPDSPPSDVAVLSVQKLLLFPKLLSLSLSLCSLTALPAMQYLFIKSRGRRGRMMMVVILTI